MFRIATTARRVHAVRRFSDLAKSNVTESVSNSGGSGGSSFFQRLTAFTIGAGIVSPFMYYFIYEELKGMIIIIYFFRINLIFKIFILLRIKPITCYSYTNIRKTYSRFRNKKITHDF